MLIVRCCNSVCLYKILKSPCSLPPTANTTTSISCNIQVKKVLEFGMKPILCIGETKDEFDLGITKEVCAMQVSKDLAGVSKEDMENVVIAYEPVWAIGTGK